MPDKTPQIIPEVIAKARLLGMRMEAKENPIINPITMVKDCFRSWLMMRLPFAANE